MFHSVARLYYSMVSWLVIAGAAFIAAVVVQYLMDRVYVDIVGKYVLVTGCDSGFGLLLARTLGRRTGCRVIAACLTEAAADRLRREASSGLAVAPILMDVTSSESIRRAYDEVKRIIPSSQGLWGLINNAGINSPRGAYHWLNRQEITSIFQVNFLGTVEVTSTFLPLLQRAGGRIVNMSSCTVMLPSIETAYTASKMAVEAYSDNLRVSMRRHGVSVHIMEPGAFKTWISDPQNILESHRKLWDRLTADEQAQHGGIERFQKEQRIMRKGLQTASPKLHLVTDAIVHALCARWPWRRYLPGLDSKLFKLMSFLPAFATDFLLGLVL